MVKKIMRDPLFLAQKSVDATEDDKQVVTDLLDTCLLYTSPSPRDGATSRMPSSA